MFVGKARAYLREEQLKGASHRWAPAVLSNIRPSRKGLLGRNTLAYYEHLKIMAQIF
jgi:hypothetical protein